MSRNLQPRPERENEAHEEREDEHSCPPIGSPAGQREGREHEQQRQADVPGGLGVVPVLEGLADAEVGPPAQPGDRCGNDEVERVQPERAAAAEELALGKGGQDVWQEQDEGSGGGDEDFDCGCGDARSHRTWVDAVRDRQRGRSDHAGIYQDLAREQGLDDKHDRQGCDEAGSREVAVDASDDEMDPDRK